MSWICTEKNTSVIYSKEKLTHIASFAKRGNGPKEVLQAINLHVVSNDSIYLFDTGKKEISLWDFSEEDTTMILKQTYKMKDDIILSSNCTWCSDTTFFFTDKSGENRILKCNRDGEIIDKIGRILLKTVDIRSPKTVISVHFSSSKLMAMQIY